MHKYLRGISIAAFIIVLSSSASFPLVYTDYMDPIDAGVGARVPGMGGAFVAAADDVNSIFYNPAGLAFAKGKQFAFGTTSVLHDKVNNSFGMYFAGSEDAFGIGIVGMNDWNPTFEPGAREPSSGRVITVESTPTNFNNTVAVLAYGTKLSRFINMPFMENLAFGISIKGFYQNIVSSDETIQGTGLNFDSGLIYAATSWLKFGLVGQNTLLSTSGGQLTWIAENGYSEPFQANYKFGISTKLLGSGSMMGTDQTLTFNMDAVQNNVHNEMPPVYHGGLEWFPVSFLAIRAGQEQVLIDTDKKNEFKTEANYTGGLGLYLGDWGIDYAYHRYGEDPDNSLHYFSASYTVPIGGSTSGESHVTAATTVISTTTATASQAAIAPLPSLEAESTEEFISINSPEDRTFIYTDSVVLSAEVKSNKVFYLDVNGITSEVSGEAGHIVLMPVSTKGTGRQDIVVVCLDDKGVTLRTYRIKLFRLPVFSDVPQTYWAGERISMIAGMKIISGYPDGTFRPGKAITRAELASVLVKASGYTTPEPTFSGYYDVDRSNWASYYIKNGSDLGLITGYPDGNFMPNSPMTRAEGVQVMTRFAQLEEPEEVLVAPFPDVPIDHWAAKAITAANDAGLLAYLGNKPFGPKQQLTRAEVAAMLSQTKFAEEKIKQLFD